MKRIFCLIAVATMLLTAATAEIDLSEMTLEELLELRTRVDDEIAQRTAVVEGERVYEDQYGYLVFKNSRITRQFGSRYLYLSFDWTSTATFDNSFSRWANCNFYQDGVQLYSGGDSLYTIVRPGTTIPIELYCTLRSENDVEFTLGWFGRVEYTATFSTK